MMDAEKVNDHISKGIALMAAEKYEEAKEQFQNAVSADSHSLEAYTHLGNACANLEQYEEALTAFKNALLVDPKSADTLYSIGSVYLLQNDRLNAVKYYNKAEQAGFKRPELYRTLAAIFMEAGDDSQALRNINRAICASPLDGELRLTKAQMYLAADRLEEAIETLDELQKVIPDAFDAYDLRAQILCGQKKYDEALRTIESGCERFPKDINLAMSKLRVLVDMEHDDEALAWLEKMKGYETFEQVLKPATMQEAILKIREGETEQAISVLEEANKRLENDADIVHFILNIYGRLEEHEKVLETSDRLIQMQPNMLYEATARYFHAYALDKLHKTEAAQEEYRALAVRLRRYTISEPAFYEGYIYRLLCHTQLGQYDKALELANYMENLYPDRADAHTFRYYIYSRQGDKEKAEEEKLAAHRIDPKLEL